MKATHEAKLDEFSGWTPCVRMGKVVVIEGKVVLRTQLYNFRRN